MGEGHHHRSSGGAVAVAGALVGVAVATFAFEHNRLLWRVGSLQIRSGQAVTLLLAASAVVVAVFWSLPRAPKWVLFSTLGYTAAVAAAWAISDQHRVSVGATASRLLLGPVLVVSLLVLVRSARSARSVVAVLLGGAALAALVGIAAVASGGELWFTDALRGRPTELGPYQRLTRPFNHANVAAMYLGPAAIIAWFVEWRSSWVSWCLSALLLGAGLLTYSRAVPIALILAMLLIGALSRGRRRRRSLMGAGLVAVSFAVALVALPGWNARINSPGNAAWYRAAIDAPSTIGSEADVVTVTIANRSEVRWESTGPSAVVLSARWRSADQDVQFGEDRFPLPEPLEPGESVVVEVRPNTPASLAPGSYTAVWDLLRDREAYFLEALGDQQRSSLEVVSAPSGTARAAEPVRLRRPEPERRTLWRAAVLLWSDRPVLGWGPGNFRHLYSDRVDEAIESRASHAHSNYLELASGAGTAGLVALVAIGVGIVGDARRRGVIGLSDVELAVLAALTVFALHGAVDYGLIFTATGSLFWVLLALWVRSAPTAAGDEP